MPLTDSQVSLLAQIPLAGVVVLVVSIFLWFLREWAKAEREARATEANEERKARAEESREMREFLREQREQTNLMFREMREQNNNALGRLADEIKSNTSELSKLAGVVLSHDAASKARNERSAR
jgi:flagellar biosynthesis component FlhA